MKLLVLVLLLFPLFSIGQWKLTENKAITGGLVVVGGAAKGFNETLMFHYKSFERAFPNANRQWFDPRVSWKNKYEDRDRTKGAAFPLSTTVLVGFTDQYHLNNLVHHAAITSALIIKIGEKQKFKYYLLDFMYYTICYQLGFAATYYTFKL